MRILVIAYKALDRRLGDGLRILGLLGPLGRRHTLDLIRFGSASEAPSDDESSVFASIKVVPVPGVAKLSPTKRLVRKLRLHGLKLASPDMQRAIREALTSGGYDLLLEAGGNSMLSIPGEDLPVPIVVDSIDEPLLRDYRALRSASFRARCEILHRMWMFWRYEKNLLARADANIYASEIDAAVYHRLFPGRRVTAIANGVDAAYFSPMRQPSEPATVLFEGNMMFGPNVDAAVRLAEEVMPALRKLIPDARAVIVGRDPSPEVMALQSNFVEVTGTVADVRPYLGKATVFACPMKLGSGIKNKILQAWAMARPVVATPASLGGLSAQHGVNILIADSMDDFVRSVAAVITIPKLAKELGDAGRATVEAGGTWEERATELEVLLAEAVNRRHQPADSMSALTART